MDTAKNPFNRLCIFFLKALDTSLRWYDIRKNDLINALWMLSTRGEQWQANDPIKPGMTADVGHCGKVLLRFANNDGYFKSDTPPGIPTQERGNEYKRHQLLSASNTP